MVSRRASVRPPGSGDAAPHITYLHTDVSVNLYGYSIHMHIHIHKCIYLCIHTNIHVLTYTWVGQQIFPTGQAGAYVMGGIHLDGGLKARLQTLRV